MDLVQDAGLQLHLAQKPKKTPWVGPGLEYIWGVGGLGWVLGCLLACLSRGQGKILTGKVVKSYGALKTIPHNRHVAPRFPCIPVRVVGFQAVPLDLRPVRMPLSLDSSPVATPGPPTLKGTEGGQNLEEPPVGKGPVFEFLPC